jgi:hypothetical protein
MEFVSIIFDDPGFTIWQVGNWQHTFDAETTEHSWEWAPRQQMEQKAAARKEFLALTQPMFGAGGR